MDSTHTHVFILTEEPGLLPTTILCDEEEARDLRRQAEALGEVFIKELAYGPGYRRMGVYHWVVAEVRAIGEPKGPRT